MDLPPAKKKYSYFSEICNLSIAEMRALVPEGIAEKDLFIVVEEEYGGESCGGWNDIKAYFRYYVEQPNQYYNQELVRYENKLKRYQKMMLAYADRMAPYLIEKAAYDKWLEEDFAIRNEKNKEKEIKRLKNALKKLEIEQ